jgi:lysophospholipid acyltransferase (LPLAT)-like uncharacterized protein
MNEQKSQTQTNSERVSKKRPKHLEVWQVFLFKLLSFLIRLWSRTLRYKFGSDVKDIIERTHSPVVVIMWHNRLFAVPEFYSRYVKNRKLAAIVSANKAGAWLSGLFEQLNIHPIRGSRNRRGTQAFREMLQASKNGYDVGVTPDGSRGPMYDMKPGAAALALRTKAPIVLLSFNFQQAFRLKSWDRFYMPWPYSVVEVKMELIEKSRELLGDDLNQAAEELKKRLNEITEDKDEDFFAEVI